MNTTTNSISVVIPAYNAEKTLARAIESALAQNIDDLEIIVANDGSNDNTAAIANRYGKSVKLISQKNGGVASARNLGITHSKNEWIAFLDADDIWYPNKLKSQLIHLNRNPISQLCWTAWDVGEYSEDFYPKKSIQELNSQIDSIEPRCYYEPLLSDCVVWTSTVMVKRELIISENCFDTKYRVGEDYDLWLRLSRVTPFIFIPESFALYVQSNTSLTKRSADVNHQALVLENALSKWGRINPNGSSIRRRNATSGLVNSWASFGSIKSDHKQHKSALLSAMRCIKLDPSNIKGWRLLAKAILGVMT